MGTPNDVVTTATVDRLARVIACAMANAHYYEENYPARCLDTLENIGRELKHLLNTFGRPLSKELGINTVPSVYGIVLKEWGYLCPSKPAYIVCFSEVGWVLVRKPGGEVSLGSKLLADIIGPGVGGMSLFIDACAYAVEELFRKRRLKLDELEEGCLLRQMDSAFHPSKWLDTLEFIRGLGR